MRLYQGIPLISEPVESDTFLAESLSDFFFLCEGDTPATEVEGELTDSDGFTANEFYVVLDRATRYCPDDNLDELVFSERERLFSEFRERCRQNVHESDFMYLHSSKDVKFIQIYEGDEFSEEPRVKSCVTVTRNFDVKLSVHHREVPANHFIWKVIGRSCFTTDSLKRLLSEFRKYDICSGNADKDLQELIPGLPIGAYVNVAGSGYSGYREGHYIGSTIRSVKCNLIIRQRGTRCEHCQVYRRTLLKTLARRKNAPQVATPRKNWLKSKTSNNNLTKSQSLQKIKQLKTYSQSLEEEVSRLRREIKQTIRQDGVALSESECADMTSLMDANECEVNKSYPDENCYQRLFWEQQRKRASLKDSRSMRWHPAIIKWCLYLKSKSSTTYDTLRNSGFIQLPSERTLFDYTNLTTKGTGFQIDVVEALMDETSNNKGHQRIVGLLQDEIRIKSDLVYDRHSGELIGFIDLGDVGNDLLQIQQVKKKESKSLARYVLVLMVRGISTNLKFPLAHFSTNGVTSDQLFSILWQGVEILECDVGLEVLFITSDGASPNRRFIHLHKTCAGTVYKANNVYSSEPRDIFFVSDAPHLIKTARNCFSNSFAHKKSRKMWKDGRDISWMHILDLYLDHCSGLYRICPKLTREHVNVTAFGAMKVRYAAQVLSSSVANALELFYDDRVTETVLFIRHMDRFFDCLNVHNKDQSGRKRNKYLEVFSDVQDERLEYLNGEFLDYFRSWRDSVDMRRGDFTRSQKNGMMLSYQTLEGIEITVKSVTACIQYCLGKGMDYVLTERFNQDPLEQHFGVHRASQGCNTNPTLKDFNNSMVKIRTVGSQALAPFRGNTRRRIVLPNLENGPLKKRKNNR